jgi:hypothetical protein
MTYLLTYCWIRRASQVEMHTASLYLNLVLVVCVTEIFFTLTNQYFIIRDYYVTFSILALG